jgi:hypothetical protein
MSRIWYFLCMQLFALCVSAALFASPTLHLLIAVDSKSNLSRGVKVDKKNITHAFKAISKAAKMRFCKKTIKPKYLSGYSVHKYLEKFDVGEDDTFCFYFSGHGFRSTTKKCPWPMLHFSASNSRLELAHVISHMKNKKPRLTIIISDACNIRKVPFQEVFLIGSTPSFQSINHQKRDNIKKLFLKTKGVIVSTAAKAGTSAWSSKYGGIFTNALLLSLQTECMKNSVSWKSVLSDAKRRCKALQKPKFSLRLH